MYAQILFDQQDHRSLE